MNKSLKGALAAGAATALLLGGAGSYALWSDTADLPAGAVTAGVLDITPVSAGTWTDISAGVPANTIVNPATTFRMVPGDVLQYDATFTVTATGKNLTATVSGAQDSVVYSGGLSPTNTTLSTTVSVDNTVRGLLTSADNGKIVAVRTTLTFNSTTGGQVGQNGSVDLRNYAVTLQQTRA